MERKGKTAIGRYRKETSECKVYSVLNMPHVEKLWLISPILNEIEKSQSINIKIFYAY